MKWMRRVTRLLIQPMLLVGCCVAQSNGDQGYFGAIFTDEGKDISDGCSRKDATGAKPFTKYVPGCLESLFHGNKGLYASFASLPPGNGVALGAVFKDSELTLEHWRDDYQIDSQGSFNGSWTAGGLLTMRLSPALDNKKHKPPVVIRQGPVPKHLTDMGENETKLLLNIYAFHTSLNQVSYYGIGPGTSPTGRAFFGLRETVAGVNAEHPLGYGFQLLGEMNGRWPNIGGDHGQSSPSIEQIYSEATAPGLTRHPGFLQFGEGLQYTAHLGSLGDKNLGMDADLDYRANFQQFVAPADSEFSFRRLTIDVTNDLHLLKRYKPKNGSATSEQVGTLELRGWLAESIAPAGHSVPFYFQPTLGGGDIDKERTLASFADYRFRAPNALLLRAQYEQPLPKISFLGVIFRADTGKVADSRGDLDTSHMRHSFGTGVTLRAGNIPYVTVMYAWAGGEGHHTFGDLNLSAISPGGGTASIW